MAMLPLPPIGNDPIATEELDYEWDESAVRSDHGRRRMDLSTLLARRRGPGAAAVSGGGLGRANATELPLLQASREARLPGEAQPAPHRSARPRCRGYARPRSFGAPLGRCRL